MLRSKTGIAVTTLLSVAPIGAVAGIAYAAGGPPGGPPGGPGFGGGRFGRFNPAQFQQRMMQRFKEALGATDQEWAVIQPKLQKVMDLSRQLRGPGMRGMFFGRFGRGRFGQNAPQGAPTPPPTPLEKATTDLQTTLGNPQATSDEIKGKLTALRAAREKVQEQLDAANKDLKSVLTIRQEAVLVMHGIID
jgi:hypothetical protein